MAYANRPPGRRKFYAYFTHPITRKKVARAGYVDRAATEKLAHRLELEAARRAEGLLPPEGGWSRRPIMEVAAEWKQALLDAGGSEKHAKLQHQRVVDVLAGCGVTRPGEIDGGRVTRWLAQQRADREDFGAATSNHYLAAARAFCRWLVRRGALARDPLAEEPKANADADPRHVRRVLTPGEFARLLAAAEAGLSYRSFFTGPARAALYAGAAGTGLRAEELSTLTESSFDFLGNPPAYVLPAADEKAGRGATLPLRPDVADCLRRHAATVPPGAPLWPGGWFEKAARMLRRDLKRAGIPYADARGRVYDFHALRAQFVTDMARAGVPLQAATKLARLSDPRLLVKHYSRLDHDDLAAELAKVRPGKLPSARP